MSGSATDRRLELSLQNLGDVPEIEEAVLRAWLEEVLRELSPAASAVGVRFVDDEEMAVVNGRYRVKPVATDVLSFPGEEVSKDGYAGDIVISVETARRQAREHGHGVEREIYLLLLHGALHCLGWDHETDDGAMARLEDRLRSRWLE